MHLLLPLPWGFPAAGLHTIPEAGVYCNPRLWLVVLCPNRTVLGVVCDMFVRVVYFLTHFRAYTTVLHRELVELIVTGKESDSKPVTIDTTLTEADLSGAKTYEENQHRKAMDDLRYQNEDNIKNLNLQGDTIEELQKQLENAGMTQEAKDNQILDLKESIV